MPRRIGTLGSGSKLSSLDSASGLRAQGLRFRIQGLGFISLQSFGFRAQGLRSRVQGLGFISLQSFGFRAQGLRFRVQGLRFRVQGLGFRVYKPRGLWV